MFQRFSDEGLAQSSYLVWSERTREAVLIDPRRDIDVYTSAATRHGVTIRYAIETHTHADFVSGARELASISATIVAGPGANLEFPCHEAVDGEVLRLGETAVELLHTPGHTFEHISIVVRTPGDPTRVFTGDTLFVGAVGRPDLVGAAETRALAALLYDSVFRKLLALPDEVEVHPGHGAGSLCGAGIGQDPFSTIGQERRFNPLLQSRSKEDFIEAVVDDLPETPGYFARMKQINRIGPPLLHLAGGMPPVPAISPTAAAALVSKGAVLIDLRSPEAFGAGHPVGAINIGFGPRVGYWAGWIVPEGAPLVLLISDPKQSDEISRQLARVGFDAVAGYIEGGFAAWRDARCAVATLDLLPARDLRDRLRSREDITVVDVRSPGEWQAGHIDESINIPVGELTSRAAELTGSATAATICESGFRSSLAASLLQRAGVPVVNVSDGIAAYRLLETVK
jgi:hydroxyacylglutathione hydrolase